jgi:phenylacetate-CoA ligase
VLHKDIDERWVRRFKRIYRFVPYSWRIGFSETPFSLRLAATYRATRQLATEMLSWDSEQIETFQMERLRSLLAVAFERVPFYRDFAQRERLTVNDFRMVEDIKRLPIVEKAQLRDEQSRFLAEGISPRAKQYVTTSGSTGIPFGFYLERGVHNAIEVGFLHSLWARHGWTPRSRSAVLRGAFIGNTEKQHFVDEDPLANALLLSTYHLTPEVVARYYVPALRRYAPTFLQAYPSAAALLSRMILDMGVELPTIRGVLLSSETIQPWQREVITEAFRCPIISWYGLAERVTFAFNSGSDGGYCFHPGYGITELLDRSGNDVTRDDEMGELILTGFHNRVTPFLRYRTSDLAVHTTEPDPLCLAFKRISRLEGRMQEFAVTEDGRFVSMVAVNMHNDVFDNVAQFQFVQNEPGRILMKIVRRPGFSDKDIRRILEEVGAKMSGIAITFDFVEEIPRTQSGKFQFLIQNLPIRFNGS